MNETQIVGLGAQAHYAREDFLDLETGGDGRWQTGRDGVRRITAPRDGKVELIGYEDHTLVYVKSAMGYPAIYPLQDAAFEPPAKAVLMDLDGTSVLSEHFWVWVIEQSTARLLEDPQFKLDEEDLPHVSGHSVSEHLRHCIKKYCPQKTVEEARKHYFDITHFELNEIMEGRGKKDAFRPAPGLKEFLLELKAHNIKIGLVTSGLYEKAWPEILSAFRVMDLGNPEEFYDAIVTAGYPLRKGQTGTLGELEAKPHPWLYAEVARVGLGIEPSERNRVIGLEDSSAGVVAIRLAGFAAIGMTTGNIEQSGARPFLHAECENLADALPVILGT